MSSHDPTPERDALVMAAKADVARALAQHSLTLAETIRVLTEEAAAYARFAIRDERAARARAPALQPRADVRCTCGWSAVAADPDDAFAVHISAMTITHDTRIHRMTGVYMATGAP